MAGLTADGFTASRLADLLQLVRDAYEAKLAALGITEAPDWERDTFLGQMSLVLAERLAALSELTQAVYDARSVANATGLQLDNLALIVGVTRQAATKGTVTLRCSGTDGTVITVGKIAQGGGADGAARWVCTQDGTIGAVSSGYVDLTFEASTSGAVVATSGQIDTIVTPVAGWSTVTNAAAATPGKARETDGALRARRQRALAAAGGTSTNAVLAALLDLDDVTGAVVVDNPTGAAATVDGISVAAYGLAAVVAPSTMSDATKALVVAAIYNHRGAGTPTSGDQSGTVTKFDGRSHTINYYFGADATVNVAWTLTMQAGSVSADVADALKDLVSDYFLTLALGATVYHAPLVALAAGLDGVADATLTLNGGSSPVTHDADEQPVLGTHTVS